MNWYLQNGKESDVVVSSRIRLARNLKDTNFVNNSKKEDLEKVLKKLENVTESIGYVLKFIRLKDIDDLTKMCLIEKHIISPDFALNNIDVGAILINEEENICIMVNEEDHIRIQVFSSGLDLEHLLNLINEIDFAMSGMISYAFSDKYGYLTACPTNVGTGLRASVMVHLPGLTQSGNVGKILEIVNNFGMNIRGVYGEGSDTKGDLYQISNKQSIGIQEKDIINNIKIIVEKIIEQERSARKMLAKNYIDLEDKVYRAYGILLNCRKISSQECEKLLSYVKLGTDLGIIKELNDLKIKKLELYTKPANLQRYTNKILDGFDRDIQRAEVIKNIIVN